ncbi:MAG: phosphoserine phosphatase SerB [Magnetovibrio sp.]|nr:phosphoserine phosphatase SerB [Magnetovibrio sp.]
MDNTLTLVAPEPDALTDAIVAEAARALNGLGAETGAADWLARGEAADIAFAGAAAGAAEAAVRDALGDAAIDLLAQPGEGRRKRLFLADMDATIVTSETLDDLAAHVGLKDHIAAITQRAMNGELEFEAAIKERVGLLEGLAETALQETYDEIEYTGGAKALVRTMAANGTHCVLVSGGFRFFTSRVAQACGFHEDHANQFVIEDGRLTGRVVEPILDKNSKLGTLRRLRRELNLAAHETMAIGDGANDLPMIQAAGLGVAFRGKPSVAAQAPARVDHADLRAMLFYQGYRAAEFAAG